MIRVMKRILWCLFFMTEMCGAAASRSANYSSAIKAKLEELSKSYQAPPKSYLSDWETFTLLTNSADVAGLARLLLQKPDCLTWSDSYGNSTLAYLVDKMNFGRFPYSPRLECLELFLECGADPNSLVLYNKPLIFRDVRSTSRPYRVPLLFRAIEIADSNVVELFLCYFADVMAVDDKGNTIFSWLDLAKQKNCVPRETDRIRRLIKGHFFTLCCKKIELSNEVGFLKIWDFLIKNKYAEIGDPWLWQDIEGVTLLHRAAEYGCYPVALLLVRAGAIVDVEDKHGGTPAHYAHYQQNTDILNLLREQGSNFNIKPTEASDVTIGSSSVSLFESYMVG